MWATVAASNPRSAITDSSASLIWSCLSAVLLGLGIIWLTVQINSRTINLVMQPSFNFAEIVAALQADACRALVSRAETVGFRPMAALYPDGYRNNDRCIIDDPALAEALFARLAPELPQTVTRDGRLHRLRRLNSRFRFCRYRGGQAFSLHR